SAWDLVKGAPRTSPFPERGNAFESTSVSRYAQAIAPQGAAYGVQDAFFHDDFCGSSARQNDVARPGVSSVYVISDAVARAHELSSDEIGSQILGCKEKITAHVAVVWDKDEAALEQGLAQKLAGRRWDYLVALDPQAGRPAIENFASPLAVRIE